MRFGVMIAAAATMLCAGQAGAASYIVDLSGFISGASTTYTCGTSAQFFCPVTSAYNGTFSVSDRLDLQQGANPFSIRSGNTNYVGTILNNGGFLSGINLMVDSVCDRVSGTPFNGCTTISARAATFNVSGGVPEPATWAMMILGLGAAGYMMRRRKVAFQPA